MAFAHTSVNETSQAYLSNEQRYNYTTPKSFLEFIRLYHSLLHRNGEELKSKMERLENGLLRLHSTSAQVSLILSPYRAFRKRSSPVQMRESQPKPENHLWSFMGPMAPERVPTLVHIFSFNLVCSISLRLESPEGPLFSSSLQTFPFPLFSIPPQFTSFCHNLFCAAITIFDLGYFIKKRDYVIYNSGSSRAWPQELLCSY
jgi:hypothetical protein